MNPKNKALDIYNIYLQSLPDSVEIDKEVIKDCALIAVNEIIEAIGWDKMKLKVDRDNYLTIVKKEIKNL